MTARRWGGAGMNHFNGYTATRTAILGFAKAFFLSASQVSVAGAFPIKEFFGTAKDENKEPDDPGLWLFLGMAAVLVLLGGAFAGLTIALMGQDGIYLQVIATSGEGKEQRHAEKVYNLLQRGKHWVLVTLLLSNVIVNETLPIVLDRSLGGGWPAVLGSTALIVIFGEVIPQSVCVRYGMQIGAFMAPFVLGLMWLLAPIAWPTAQLLDYLLGEDHGTTYKKSGLKTLVTLHKTLGSSPGDRLNQDEVTIISAVLDLKDKAVGDIMTPMEDVFTMSAATVLDENTMDIILSAGYSRIPIYEPGNEGNFVGMLLVKILITYDPEDCKRVSDFALATLPETRPETSCLDIVNFFQEGKSHMVLVSDYPGEDYGSLGVVTLEDVIEELIGEEIIDESDVYIDVHKAIRRMAPAPKARVHKGHVIAPPEDPVPEEHLVLIETDETDIQREPTHRRHGSIDSRSNTAAVFGSSPKTTFLMRRSSSATGGTPNAPVAIRGNAVDMREHLKHLGPSNLASRPKTTRWQTVKIKPARPTASPVILALQESTPEPYRDEPAPQGGEGTGLLKSAGREASDGVQALQQGYGTYGSFSKSPPTKTTNENYESGQVDGSVSPSKASPPWTTGKRTNSDDTQSDTIRSLPSSKGSPAPRKRNPARSGSITENIIDAGGVRKVVLEMNSSSEDPEAEGKHGRPSASTSRTTLSLNIDGNAPGGEEYERDAEGEQVKKKAKRRRKRKGGNRGDDLRSGSATSKLTEEDRRNRRSRHKKRNM